MHEMGIILHIAKMLDETAEEQHITKIGSVTLEVGEVSGIMTDLFVDCWNYFKVKHPVLPTRRSSTGKSAPTVTVRRRGLWMAINV